QLLSGAIGDSDAAAERFERCLAIDGEFVPAMAALEEIHCERGEWDSALAMLQNQIDRARELPARSRLMVRQAVIHGDAFGDRERAQHLYETAVELDPTNVAAAGPLAMLFVEQQEWARAWPLFELQLRQDVGR